VTLDDRRPGDHPESDCKVIIKSAADERRATAVIVGRATPGGHCQVRVSGYLYGSRDAAASAASRLAAVLVQIGLERELAPTARAFVVLGDRVRLDVSSQVRPVGERFAAVSAAKRLLAGVRTLMSSQQPRP